MVLKILVFLCLLRSCIVVAKPGIDGTEVENDEWISDEDVNDDTPGFLLDEIRANKEERDRMSHKREVKRLPIVLVPGLGGSQLWAKLTNKQHKPHLLCSSSTKDYYSIWLSLTQLLPPAQDCFIDNFKLHYDMFNHTTHNSKGVNIQPLNFGHPKSVEWIEPNFDFINFNQTLPHQSRVTKRSALAHLSRYVSEASKIMEKKSIDKFPGHVSTLARLSHYKSEASKQMDKKSMSKLPGDVNALARLSRYISQASSEMNKEAMPDLSGDVDALANLNQHISKQMDKKSMSRGVSEGDRTSKYIPEASSKMNKKSMPKLPEVVGPLDRFDHYISEASKQLDKNSKSKLSGAFASLNSEYPEKRDRQYMPKSSQDVLNRLNDFMSQASSGMEKKSKLMGDADQVIARLKDLEKKDWTDVAETVLRLIVQRINLEVSYFAEMAHALVASGYRRGEDLLAAPYDFRKAPNEMSDFFKKTQLLIEDAYRKNGNSRVVIVAHSMGNPVMLYFYNHVVDQVWKDTYIQSHVALAAPWGGSVKSLKSMISGVPLAGGFFDAIKARIVERSMPSTAWLMPRSDVWGPREVLVSTPGRNYTVRDYQQLFRDLNFINGYEMWLDTRDLVSNMTFPGLEMHCLYGLGVDTPGRLIYTNNVFPDQDPQVERDDGDGTVNRRSLEAFLPWTQHQNDDPNHPGPTVRGVPLEQVDHMGILKNPKVIRYVLEVATQ